MANTNDPNDIEHGHFLTTWDMVKSKLTPEVNKDANGNITYPRQQSLTDTAKAKYDAYEASKKRGS